MRVLLFVCVFCVAVLMPFPFFVASLLVYMFFYTGLELLFIGVCIDAVFGASAQIDVQYTYTLTIGCFLVCTQLIKPYLKFYNS